MVILAWKQASMRKLLYMRHCTENLYNFFLVFLYEIKESISLSAKVTIFTRITTKQFYLSAEQNWYWT